MLKAKITSPEVLEGQKVKCPHGRNEPVSDNGGWRRPGGGSCRRPRKNGAPTARGTGSGLVGEGVGRGGRSSGTEGWVEVEEEDEEDRAGGEPEPKGRLGEVKVEAGSGILGFSRANSRGRPLPSTFGTWDTLWGYLWRICGPNMDGKMTVRRVIVEETWAS